MENGSFAGVCGKIVKENPFDPLNPWPDPEHDLSEARPSEDM